MTRINRIESAFIGVGEQKLLRVSLPPWLVHLAMSKHLHRHDSVYPHDKNFEFPFWPVTEESSSGGDRTTATASSA
jgi:hypothetical protein